MRTGASTAAGADESNPASHLHGPVLAWFDRHGRTELPWRDPDCSAWGVFLSEVMSQQTPLHRVEPVWREWMRRWPTPADLAADSPGEAVRAWRRLGYPRRALRLHEAATAMVRRHRLMETFLVNELGYGWDEVHDEAEVLEHAMSDRFMARLDTKLGHPDRDPHGDPIPRVDGSIPAPEAFSLADLDTGEGGRIARISDTDPEVLRYFDQLGVALDCVVHVSEKRPFAGTISISIDGAEPIVLAGVEYIALEIDDAEQPLAPAILRAVSRASATLAAFGPASWSLFSPTARTPSSRSLRTSSAGKNLVTTTSDGSSPPWSCCSSRSCAADRIRWRTDATRWASSAVRCASPPSVTPGDAVAASPVVGS